MNSTEELQKAVQHHKAGRLSEAEAIYRQVLSNDPANAGAMNLLGVASLHRGQFAVAQTILDRAIALAPAKGEYYFNLGLSLAGQRKSAQALAAYRQAVALDPRNAAAWCKMGDALLDAKLVREAEEAIRKAMSLRVTLPEPHNLLGKVRYHQGDLSGAIASFRQAVAFEPQYVEALNNLGQTLCESGRCREGAEWCEKAIAIDPNLGIAHWNLSLMRLRLGDWERAWPGFEWRYRTNALNMVNPYPHPMWDGGELSGKRILLHAEQGLGDTIQFLRYAPLVAARGGKVMVALQRELLSLVEGFSGIERFVVPGDQLPPIDLQCPLPSLPGRFKTTPTTVPGPIPYLKPDPHRVAKWRGRLVGMARPFVGLSWGGSRLNPDDARRSLPLRMLAPLTAAAKGTFFSLQKGEVAAEIVDAPMPLLNWTDELVDVAETAALVENLDLIMTVDTMLAHLAGAMGRPVWILLHTVPDWRWMLEREDSPWYPTARLFRQDQPGIWSVPIARAAEALRAAPWH